MTETTGKPDVSEYLRRGYSMRFDIWLDSNEAQPKVYVGGQLAAYRRYWHSIDPAVHGQVIALLDQLVTLMRQEDARQHALPKHKLGDGGV